MEKEMNFEKFISESSFIYVSDKAESILSSLKESVSDVSG